MTALYIFIGCSVFLLGCALPLLRNRDLPKPPPGGWLKIEDEEDQ